MKCRRVRHLLLDFVDGLGTESLHAEVERHLAQCSECEAFATESTRSLALLRRTPVEPLDDNFNWKVRLAIHREEKARAKGAASTGAWVQAWNFRYVASTGVAFALVLGAGVVLMSDRLPTSPSMESTTRSTVVSNPGASRDVAAHRNTRALTSPSFSPSTTRGVLVNTDGEPSSTGVETRGAIDRWAQEVAMDSVIDARLVTMTPEMRTRCIQRQIHRLQAQLERQPAAPTAPKP
jgi:hypothetical protein